MRQQLKANPQFHFSNDYHHGLIKLKEVSQRLQYACELTRFLLRHDYDQAKLEVDIAEAALFENIDKLFKGCELLGIPRIFIGSKELVTALPDSRSKHNSITQNTLVWALRDMVGEGNEYRGSCGNTNQYQTNNAVTFMPAEYLDKAWDVATRTQIPLDEFKRYMVVSKDIKYRKDV